MYLLVQWTAWLTLKTIEVKISKQYIIVGI